jgi:hypothetical protein
MLRKVTRWLSRAIAAVATALALLASPVEAGVIPALFSTNPSSSITYQTPTYVQGDLAHSTSNGTSITVTYATAQTMGDCNVIAIGWSSNTATITGVTDSVGNTYASASSPVTTSASGGWSQQIWYAPNIGTAAAGGNVVTINFSASVGTDVRATEYSGIATSSPLDVIPSGGGSSATTGTSLTSGSATTTQATDLIVGAAYVAFSASAGAGFNSRLSDSNGNLLEDEVVTSTGSYAATATQSSSGFWMMNMVALKASTVSAGGSTLVPAFVQQNTQQGTSTPSTTQTATFINAQTGNDLNVLSIGWSNSTSTITSVVDSAGNSYSIASPLVTVSGNASLVMYYSQNIKASAAGANTVTVTLSAAAPFLDVTAAEYSGIATSGALDVNAGAGSSSVTALNSGSATTTQATELLVGADYVQNQTAAVGSGYTARTNGNNLLEDENVTSIGSYSATATQSPAGVGIMELATFKAAGGVPTTTAFGVKASGNKLISTQTGAQVTLIGSVASGCEMFSGNPGRCNQWAAQPMSWWATTWKAQAPGFNAVRFHLNSQMWLGGSSLGGSFEGSSCSSLAGSGTGAALQNNIKTIVANATAAGVYVILDLANDAPPGFCAIGEPGYESTYATTFWQQVAQAFGGNPAVILEIFNEPYGFDASTSSNAFCAGYGSSSCGDPVNPAIGPDSTLLANGGTFGTLGQQNNANGDAAVTTTTTYTVVGELQLLQTIRATGATNLVLTSPWWFAGAINLWPQTYGIASGNPDPLRNLGAAMHAYGYDNSSVGNTTALSTLVNDGYPLLITEFCTNNAFGRNCTVGAGQGAGLGDTIGNLVTASSLISLGVSALIGCCDNDWGGGAPSIGPGVNGWLRPPGAADVFHMHQWKKRRQRPLLRDDFVYRKVS